jgi:hypothetical protein
VLSHRNQFLDRPMTTKLAAFFRFDFAYSATTSRFLLFSRGCSSQTNPSRLFVTWSALLFPFACFLTLLLPFGPGKCYLDLVGNFPTYVPPLAWALVTISSGLGPVNALDLVKSGSVI